MRKLLIANRGEIAIRIARAAAGLGITSVAIYSEDDAASLHRYRVDLAIPLRGRGPRAYLDIQQIIEIAKREGVDGIHPGYGFLSENPEFARAAEVAHIVFVGPTSETLEVFGDKARARRLAESCEIPVLRGGDCADVRDATAFFKTLPPGHFMMIKAARGGGGRGIRLVRSLDEVDDAFERAASEASSAFGDSTLYAEEFLPSARHIEVQIVGDGSAVSHLWERECSLQRRYQKIVEVAPSPSLRPELRLRILDAAVRLARAVSYRGMGTMEFLVTKDGNEFRFIEGNPRIQVEHTVTEEILNLDLVRQQLEIARGRSLAALELDQANVPECHGVAVECRVNLESFAPDGTVRPAGGRLTTFEPPTGPGVRVDTYGYAGYQTNPLFDSLIAKVVCHSPAADYADAIARARRALREMRLIGAPTNLAFLIALLGDERVRSNEVDTGFIDANAKAILQSAEEFLRTDGSFEPQRPASGAAENQSAVGGFGAVAEQGDGRAVSPNKTLDRTVAHPPGTRALGAPMAGVVVGINVAIGDAVPVGRTVAIIEAMKMQHEISAESSGDVRLIAARPGDTVFEGDPLLFIEERHIKRADGEEERSTDSFRGRAWQDDVSELRRRHEMAEAMGGPEGIARQRRQGKLTARERIAALADANSFREFMTLEGEGAYENGEIVGFTPKPHVDGTLTIDGRKVFVTAGDFTVRGGSGGAEVGGIGREPSTVKRAVEWRLPLIRLLDTAGGSVRSFEEMGRTYPPDGNVFSTLDVQALSLVPTVSAVLGSVAGLPAIDACFSHFSVMVKGIAQIFPGGPPVVKAALGVDISKDELGGAHIHTRVSGCINNVADTEADAFRQIRGFLSYLPSNVYELPPHRRPERTSVYVGDDLLKIVPRDGRRSYDAHKLVNAIVDENSFFEISPLYGRSRTTGLARIDGYPVGIMANNPLHDGGLTGVDAGSKVIQLIQLCDTFHLPLISLADEPGFMVGLEEEKRGIERSGARLVAMICNSRMPWITIVVGKVFGVGGQCHQRPSGMYRRFVWPSASWGSMHITGGVSAAYRREIESSPDPKAKQLEIEARLRAFASPFRTAEATGQDIIDPRETRDRLIEFIRDAQLVLATQLGPPRYPYLP